MSKKPRCRTSLNSQHTKGSQTLLKSIRQHIDHICQSLWGKWSWKMYLLAISSVLGSPITAIQFLIVRTYANQLKCNYLRNKNPFLNFLLHFQNLHQFLNNFKRKMTPIVYIFSKLSTAKDVVKWKSKKPHFRIPFHNQHDKGIQILPKPGRQHFYHIFPSPWGKWGWQMSLLVISKFFGK